MLPTGSGSPIPFTAFGTTAWRRHRHTPLRTSDCAIGSGTCPYRLTRFRLAGGRVWPMPIDDCKHTFLELTTTVLPAHMRRMRDAMERPVRAAIFAQTKQGPGAIAKQLRLPGDFAGCYIFMDLARPIYTGISRKVLSRIRQHLCGKTHFDASLAYRMAKRKMPTRLKRGEAMKDSAF